MAAADDARFMRMALALGRRGLGRTSPNPPVGAVVVRAGKVVGRGYHRAAGLPHGEIEALRDAGRLARGATVYVTLEPCAHHGRTPPCTEALVAAGVRRVVYGIRDPNPRVVGDGRLKLESAGIEVLGGIEEAACAELNAAFCKRVSSGSPLVTLKLAASLDGRIATRSGDSRWITNERSRRFVHRLRNESDAVLVGAGTVRADDPELTCRLRGGRNPVRILVDGRLRVPEDAMLIRTASTVATIVATSEAAPPAKLARLCRHGVEVWILPGEAGRIELRELLRRLAARGISSVLVEGGATMASEFLAARLVDRLLLFYAPRLIGGDGRPMVASLGIEHLRDALLLGNLQVRRFAGDLLVATQVIGP